VSKYLDVLFAKNILVLIFIGGLFINAQKDFIFYIYTLNIDRDFILTKSHICRPPVAKF